MTFGTTAMIHDSTTHPAKALRNMTAGIMGQPTISHANAVTATTRGGAHGVVGDGDMLVTWTSGLGYSVAAGRAFVAGTFSLAQGSYSVYNDAAVVGTLAARDATNPRISLICVRVRDTDTDATGAEDVGLIEVAGVAAASPAVPSVPSSLGSLLILSQVTVPPGAAAPTFSDVRPYAAALGGTLRCKSTTKPTGAALYTGLTIYETDTGNESVWTGAAWRQTSPTCWGNQKTFQINNATSFPSDLTIPFDASTVSGVGVITITTYVGFANAGTTANFGAYTNSYSDPTTVSGWATNGYAGGLWSLASAGVWYPGPTLTLHVPVTAGGSPHAVFRIISVTTATNMYVRGSAVVQVMPGTWTNP